MFQITNLNGEDQQCINNQLGGAELVRGCGKSVALSGGVRHDDNCCQIRSSAPKKAGWKSKQIMQNSRVDDTSVV